MESKNYYIGLDIGTDSIGYAAADESYRLLKYKGEPVWGSHIIEEANLKTERRQHRTERRRLDRRQQRVTLIREIFAKEIAKIDPDFYKREEESALLAEDASTSKGLFTDIGYTDKKYHKSYPTIHHLINELMTDAAPHDVRLVYLACAWLVAHRGHFLSEVSLDNVESVVDFKTVYDNLTDYFAFEIGCEPAWDNADPDEIEKILVKKIKSTSKINELNNLLFGKKKPETEITDAFPFSRPGIIKLLCGKDCSAKDLFGKEEYAEIKSLKLDDDELDSNLSELGDDAELVLRLKAVYDCVTLHDVLGENKFISAAKVETYEQHKRDLAELKKFIKKYAPEKYNEIFRKVDKSTANYSAYSGNIKSDKNTKADWKKATPENFCTYILKIVNNITPAAEDKAFFDDMIARLQKDVNTFMPKQVNGDNRVIPYQLYYVELKKILENAEKYLPFLSETDEEGYLTKDKILSVFTFRIPYYVGPLNASSPYAWIKRKAGRITPWNFSEMVDGNESEQGFINKLIGVCSYLPGEKVLPKQSLLYQRFTVLNEINNITINGLRISPEIKQLIYNDVFKKNKKVSVKKIKDSLRQNNHSKDDVETIAGIDISIKSSLSSYISFRRLLESGTLNETDVEKIIKVSTYMESRPRFKAWLEGEYPNLSDNDVKYITSLKFKDFGRLSEKFLCAILGSRKNNEKEDNGEASSIIDALWNTNKNLMELLSDDYTYSDAIKRYSDNYYMANGAKSLDERMDDMYLSNAVRRPIYRVLDIVSDIVKAEGKAPNKIFVEMARGAKPDEKKGQRKTSRYDTLKDLYKTIDTDDVRRLEQELEKMGDEANSRLQSERLFLYYLQRGRCMYSGEEIDLNNLMGKRYDIDHIYPRSKVKDDSLFNNKVLVKSKINGSKDNNYPLPENIRENMSGMWKKLLDGGLITEEKYRRLTRKTGFTDDEAWGFINRQMVETRQSTKAVATLLKEYYPNTKIVYVKAGLVSEFRHEKKLWKAILPEEERYLDDSQIEPWKTELWKSRTVNDLHHAKDAYLNIVAGNVYHEKCTKPWYLSNKDNYSINLISLYSLTPYMVGERKIWDGVNSLETVWKTVHKNAVHYTIYPFSRKGGLFKQNPLKKNADLTPLKNNGEIYLDPKKYGGYNKPTATFFVLVKYYFGKKSDVMLMPVDLAIAEKYKSDSQFRFDYAKSQIQKMLNKSNKSKIIEIDRVEFPLGNRIIKINTMLEIDGYRMVVASKYDNSYLYLSPLTSLNVDSKWEFYCKKLENFSERKNSNPNMIYSEKFDYINSKDNEMLYDILVSKLSNTVHSNRPLDSKKTVNELEKNKNKFMELNIFDQTDFLLKMFGLFNRKTSVKLAPVASETRTKISYYLSNWKKSYSDVRIIDTTASGLFEHRSCNLLDLL